MRAGSAGVRDVEQALTVGRNRRVCHERDLAGGLDDEAPRQLDHRDGCGTAVVAGSAQDTRWSRGSLSRPYR